MSGSHRVSVQAGVGLPEMTWEQELAGLTDAWPYVCPVFLGAAEKTMPEAVPFHTIASRGRGELALLPGYVLAAPSAVDHDPRTYLGWQARAGEEACCGAGLPSGQPDEAAAIGEDSAFPCLLLGSPVGYRTEVAFNFWTPRLFGDMVTATVHAAADAGIRSVLAPWIPSRSGNDDLIRALTVAGGHTAFWGYEDYLPLRAQTWDSHLAEQPYRIRRRITGDEVRAAASGTEVMRLQGEAIRPHVARIAELTCLNREKNGSGQELAQVEAMLTRLLDAGSDIRAYLGLAGDAVVGSCVVLRKEHRLFPKWAGFDYSAIGDRSGLYFAMNLNAPVRDAYAEGLRAVEFGAGSHQAKQLRGCSSREVSTVLLLMDDSLRERARALQDAFAQSRHAAFGDSPPAAPGDVPARPLLEVIQPGQSACCSGG